MHLCLSCAHAGSQDSGYSLTLSQILECPPQTGPTISENAAFLNKGNSFLSFSPFEGSDAEKERIAERRRTLRTLYDPNDVERWLVDLDDMSEEADRSGHLPYEGRIGGQPLSYDLDPEISWSACTSAPDTDEDHRRALDTSFVSFRGS